VVQRHRGCHEVGTPDARAPCQCARALQHALGHSGQLSAVRSPPHTAHSHNHTQNLSLAKGQTQDQGITSRRDGAWLVGGHFPEGHGASTAVS